MSLILRLVKGSALTYAEMDGNLTYLDNKVTGSEGYITLISGSNAVSSSILYQSGNTVYATGSIDVNGAISASYFVGDGSGLFNIDAFHSVATASISASVNIGDRLFYITSESVNFGEINLLRGNTSFGQETIWSGSNGNYNTAFGYKTLRSNTAGALNVAVGDTVLEYNTVGLGNTGVGTKALAANISGNANSAFGGTALVSLTTGNFNTAIGGGSLTLNNRSNNTALGYESGRNNISGSGNVFLGYQAGRSELGSNKLYISNNSGSEALIKGDFSTGLLQFNTPGGTFITGSVSILSPNKSSFQVNGDIRQFIFADTVDTLNQFQVALSGSIFNSSPQIFINTGDKGLNVEDILKVKLSDGVEVTGSLVVSGSNTFRNIGRAEFTGSVNISGSTVITGSTDITGSLTVNGQQIIASNQTSSLTVLSASYAETASYALNSGLLSGKAVGEFAITGSNVFKASQTISGSLFVTGGIAAQSRSLFGSDLVLTGQNAVSGNNVAFLDLAGASGSRIDFHGRNGISTLYTVVNNVVLDVPTGSVVFGVDKGSIALYSSESILLNSDVTSSANMAISGSILVGTSSFTPGANEKLIIDAGDSVSYNLITGKSNTDNYNQFNIQNRNSGSNASADIVATNDLGDENTYYVNLGINSSTHTGTIGGPNDAYLYTTGSHLHILNITPDKNIILSTSGSGIIAISGSSQVSGSTTQNGNFILTGSFLVTGSTTQIGNNSLLGNTSLSGSIIMSGSENPDTPTIQIYGDTQHTGVVRFNPIARNIDNSISASYIYVSGSTNDLFFTQNGKGYANTTRLRWLEGNLYTGLLNGGLITTQSSTVFQVSSGSGIIVDLNASYNDNPYPTIQFITWPTLSSSIAPLSASYDQSFVAIQASGSVGQLYVQGTPYNDGQFNTLIPIGNVIHQNRSTINATATYPSVAYGYKQRSSDFIRAFGPLKLSGLATTISGSSTGSILITPGTAFSDGRNYSADPNNPSYIQDPGSPSSKIFRYYQSGSSWGYLTNGGAGYETIDPTQYSNNGVLTPVPTNNFSIQRVYYFPGGATKGIYVYYGNAVYATLADAVANIPYEQFSEAPNTAAGAVLSSYLIVRSNASFQTSGSYRIEQAGLFRNTAGGGGGGTVNATRFIDLTDVDTTSNTLYNYQPIGYNGSTLKFQNLNTISASLLGNATTATTASFAITSSYALTASHADNLTVSNGAFISGSVSISGSLKSLISINQQSGSTYTLTPSDLNQIIEMNTVSGSTNYVVVPDNAITPLPIGFECTVVQYGEGDTIIEPESINVLIRSELNRTTLGLQYAPASLVKRGVNEWYLFGRLK